MMAATHGSVRMGPMSILVLIAVLSLAVMAVLTASIAHATYASATRQAAFTTDTYQNETVAQQFVASLDETLLGVREGISANDDNARPSVTAGEAAETVSDTLPSMLKRCSDANPDCTAAAKVQESTVFATFTSPNGRVLDVAIEILDGGTYSIQQWKTSAEWNNETNDTLWTGNVGETNMQGDAR